MTTATAIKEVKKASVKEVKKAEVKKEVRKDYSFSQFNAEYNKKSDRLALSVVRIEKGKATGEKNSCSLSVRPFLPLFEKIRKITDGKQKRKEALKSVSVYVKQLKTIAPRAHVLRPIIECIKENFGKDYSTLLQKSFQR